MFFDWNFGDGSIGVGVQASHTYDIPGIYEATLTVSDDDGATATASVIINVTGGSSGALKSEIVSTNRKGESGFSITGDGGTYTLSVTNITKAGPTFDPDNSVLTESVTKN